jgi:hypothetical protein
VRDLGVFLTEPKTNMSPDLPLIRTLPIELKHEHESSHKQRRP